MDKKSVVALEAFVLDKSEENNKSTRLFVDLVDHDGEKYVEVVGDSTDPDKPKNTPADLTALLSTLRDQRVEIKNFTVAGGVNAIAPNSLIPRYSPSSGRGS